MKVVTERELVNCFGALPWADPRVVVSGNFATPRQLMELFDSAVESYRLFVLNAQKVVPVRSGVIPETPFVGPGMRDLPQLDYLPMRLSLVPKCFAAARPPRLVLLHTSPPYRGKVSLGTEVDILPAALEQVRANGGLVVAQTNPQMPYTFGDGEIEVDAVDLAFECEEPLMTLERGSVSDVAAAIGEEVVDLVPDGATIQVGIGEVPDALLSKLTTRRGLKVWSEAISDGILDLERAGALDKKAHPVTTTFLFGSSELYRWVDRNHKVRVLRTEAVNDPAVIAKHAMMCSINGALQVDLHAQANATFVNGRVYSGFGGQPDFVVGALHAEGGQAIVALPSWHQKSNTSTIVARLCEPTTSFQHSAVVTEQGRALLFGRSERAQTRLLIEETAHPDARAELWSSVAPAP
jgi:acyl-CoA hydrolase